MLEKCLGVFLQVEDWIYNMFCAMAKIKGTGAWSIVTLHCDLFFADKGLIEMFIEYSSKKHPDWEYMIRSV